MITLAWYLLKVITCSGILYGYYYIGLRNKIYHRWNRFYLLASIVLALVVPLMKINIFQRAGTDKGAVIRMLQTINNSDEIIIEYGRHGGMEVNAENMITAAYLLITSALLCIFFMALHKISRLKKKYPGTKLKGINFISTDAKGTPFSFFNVIFWNNAIDLHSRQGHQIFNHEIVHVKEKHSYDKVFMNVILVFFWFNPFFWLMQKEISMIHEFIADKEALEDDDINAFAEMVLQTVYPGQHFSLTSNFFNSPLKRRLIMFTKNKHPKVSYASRLLVLPLAAMIVFAFTLKMKTIGASNYYSGKKITVIIDAGHGGSDDGVTENNIKEKDLNLLIAKEIKVLNKNENIRVILSREEDKEMTVQDRVKFAESNKADLFVSIHMDAEVNKDARNGVKILIPKDGNAYLKESKLLGSAIIESFKNNTQLPVADYLQQLEPGIFVLKENQFPAVLIETGFLTNRSDFDYITKSRNQQTIAKDILDGIEKYAGQNLLNTISSTRDTRPSRVINTTSNSLPDALFVVDGKVVSKDEALSIMSNSILSVNVLKGDVAIKKYGEKGKNGVIEIDKKNSHPVTEDAVKDEPAKITNPLYFVDGREISKVEMKQISPNNIESINVLKAENAVKKYGEKGKNGVVEIAMKKYDVQQTDTLPDKVFTKVENEAEFPGGGDAWLKYISQIQKNQDKFTNKDFGTCLVKFIVNTDGSVTNVEDSTMKNTQLAKVAVEAIRYGPRWIPAKQNDHVVAAYRLQPITLTAPK